MSNVKFVNGELVSDQDIVILKSSGKGGFTPIGTIMGVHKDSTSNGLIDTDFWVLCDGSGVSITFEDGTPYAFTLPDLTDDRFLMGSSNLSPLNVGDNDGHYHSAANLSGTTGNYSGALGSHTHGIDDWDGGENGGRFQADANCAQHFNTTKTTSTPNTIAHRHNLSFAGNAGDIGGFDGNALGSNRPNYYKCDFYMRVK